MLKGGVTWHQQKQTVGLKGGGSFTGPRGVSATLQFLGEEAIPQGILAGLHRAAEAAEAFMKANAPWTDRTGQARAGLHAEVIASDNTFVLSMGHGQNVEYGIWLETRFNGRFAIVIPTQIIFSSRLEGFIKNEIELALSGKGSQFRHRATGRFA